MRIAARRRAGPAAWRRFARFLAASRAWLGRATRPVRSESRLLGAVFATGSSVAGQIHVVGSVSRSRAAIRLAVGPPVALHEAATFAGGPAAAIDTLSTGIANAITFSVRHGAAASTLT